MPSDPGTQAGASATKPPSLDYHAEVVGSLLRTDKLKDAMGRDERGEIEADELKAIQDEFARDSIRLQEECGIEVVTDGEARRRFWFDPLTVSLSGYDPTAPAPVPFHGKAPESEGPPPRLPAVTEKLGRAHNLCLEEYEFTRANTDRGVKVTIAGMTYASVLWVPGISDGVYPDRDEYMDDALRLMTEVVAECVAAGADYVQLDSPRYTHLVSEEGQENLRRVGLDTETWLGKMIEYDNRLIDAFPDVTFGVHLCRGNHRSMWSVEGSYDAIAEQLFSGLHAHRILAEYDSPRAGTFAPLRFVPDDRVVVLGLITTKEPELESADDLKRRIDEASEHVPLERLALSPQCGFASTLPGNLVTFDDERAKLELLGSVAHEIWG
jgi:5-methyltetrahydropteroyltriglutamate--homocysteine methyltransferase